MPPRASASCEVWVDDEQLACTPDDLFDGVPTVLDDLTIQWGRDGLWEQPDGGGTTFRVRDQRTDPGPVGERLHVGAKVDVWAAAPNPNPVPENVIDIDFSASSMAQRWRISAEVAGTVRRNRATDPSFTTTTGKTAGGSATLAIDAAWAQYGSGSLRITPNGSSNASAVYPQGSTGLTVFESGKTYTVSVYVRLTAAQLGTLAADARKIRLHAGAVSAPVVATSAAAPNAAGVTRLSLTFTVDPTWTICAISIMNGSPNAGSQMWVDGLLIQEGPYQQPYFDGTTTRTGYTYSWAGTANSSQSIESRVATDPTATLTDSSVSPPEGSRFGWMDTEGTGAYYIFLPGRSQKNWGADVRAMMPGETWTYSFMLRTNFISGDTTLVEVKPVALTDSDPDTLDLNSLRIDGGQVVRTLAITDANWTTYSGTITNPGTRPVWVGLSIRVPPEAYSTLAGGYPGIDKLVITAPARTEYRMLVWAGRITDVTVEPAERSAIQYQVTATGEIAQQANYTVGDTPWPASSIRTRLLTIYDALPLTLKRQFAMIMDAQTFAIVAGRDVDKQPVLDLIRDYVIDCLSAAWPINTAVTRSMLWIENMRNRIGTWSGITATISACNLPKGSFAIGQGGDQLVTVVDVNWKEPDGGDYLDSTVTIMDDPAVELYGARLLQLDTELITLSSATELADDAMALSRGSDWYVKGVEFDTRRVDNTDGLAQALLLRLLNSATRPASKITITELPEWVPADVAAGFVEGGTIEYVGGRWRFDLNMTAAPA